MACYEGRGVRGQVEGEAWGARNTEYLLRMNQRKGTALRTGRYVAAKAATP